MLEEERIDCFVMLFVIFYIKDIKVYCVDTFFTFLFVRKVDRLQTAWELEFQASMPLCLEYF